MSNNCFFCGCRNSQIMHKVIKFDVTLCDMCFIQQSVSSGLSVNFVKHCQNSGIELPKFDARRGGYVLIE
jgi:hypothetical protein